MRATTEAEIKAGDHVKIVGVHPWSGATGEVLKKILPPLGDRWEWEVQLDGGGTGADGHRCMVPDSNLKVI